MNGEARKSNKTFSAEVGFGCRKGFTLICFNFQMNSIRNFEMTGEESGQFFTADKAVFCLRIFACFLKNMV